MHGNGIHLSPSRKVKATTLMYFIILPDRLRKGKQSTTSTDPSTLPYWCFPWWNGFIYCWLSYMPLPMQSIKQFLFFAQPSLSISFARK
jgi:hypothetical protein